MARSVDGRDGGSFLAQRLVQLARRWALHAEAAGCSVFACLQLFHYVAAQFDFLDDKPATLRAVGIIDLAIVPLGRRRLHAGAVVIVPAVVNLNSFSTALVVLLVVELNIRAGLSYGPDT